MIAVVTVLLALPLGFLVRSRVAATLAYAIVYLWAFVFQTLYLLLDSLDPDGGDAFDPDVFPLSYGLVTGGILVVGIGLVQAGHVVGTRRREARAAERLVSA